MSRYQKAWIIDDDKIYIFSMRRLMTHLNFSKTIEVFNDGYEAINQLQLHSKYKDQVYPDIILLDINMPVWDGWEFIRHFELIPNTKKILLYVVSSSLKPQDKQKAESYDSVNKFYVKPITLDGLKEIMGFEAA